MTRTNKLLKLIIALLLIAVILLISIFTIYTIFPQKHKNTVNKYCNEYGVDPNLVYALIKAESNFNEDAVSNAGAKGMMQLTDETFYYCLDKMNISAKDTDIFDPDINIRVGTWYLANMLTRYDANVQNAIAAYNAGATNVDKWLSSPKYSSDGKTLDTVPFGETDRHIKKIDRYKKIYAFVY